MSGFPSSYHKSETNARSLDSFLSKPEVHPLLLTAYCYKIQSSCPPCSLIELIKVSCRYILTLLPSDKSSVFLFFYLAFSLSLSPRVWGDRPTMLFSPAFVVLFLRSTLLLFEGKDLCPLIVRLGEGLCSSQKIYWFVSIRWERSAPIESKGRKK